MTRNSKRQSVAVLGAGIMGSSIALFLARQGIPVHLIDKADAPFTGASRWNEGKIHLGYMYGADPTLETARAMIPGGLNFPDIVRELVGRDITADMVTPCNDRYLIHRDSVVSADEMLALAQRISALTREHPAAARYFVPMSEAIPRMVPKHEVAADYNTDIIRAVMEVPERSVSTIRLADYFIDALRAEPLIHCQFGHQITAVQADDGARGRWRIKAISNEEEIGAGPFGVVVNALWEGRRAIDATAGLAASGTWTNRYRVSVFARLRSTTSLRSGVIALGPFGDVKNYNGRDLYLSWYKDGLLAESHELLPPQVSLPDAQQEPAKIKSTLDNLARVIPGIAGLAGDFEECRLKGGWVYAAGRGALSDRSSALHRRNEFGAFSTHGYFSVDTGKYSTAPYMAREIASAIAQTLT